MIRILFFFIFLLFSALANGQQKNLNGQEKKLLDSIIELTQLNSIFKNKINWDSLKVLMYKNIDLNSSNEVLAIIPAIGLMLDSLKDNHSIITYNKKTYGRTTKVNLFARVNKETKKAIGWPNVTPISIKHLTKQIGYISVPAMNVDPENMETQIKQFSQNLRDSLCQLNIDTVSGTIVDLRLNTGGSMYPMLGGIGALLENGRIGSFETQNLVQVWNIQNGNFYLGNQQITDVKNNCIPNKKIKIAILIGPATSSSGEALAISFIGQKNVKTFGEKSTGLTSANNQYKIRNDLYFSLASGYEKDRTGKIYIQEIDPDIEIDGGDNFEDLLKDEKIEAAINWITKN